MYPSFDWDDKKAKANASKHPITFTSAIEVFKDLWVIEEPDRGTPAIVSMVKAYDANPGGLLAI